MTVGERLKHERTRLGVSQKDFAAAGGVGKNTQIAYEKDERSPDTNYLLAVSALGVDIVFVLTGKHIQEGVPELSHIEMEIVRHTRTLAESERDIVRRFAYGLKLTENK